MDLDIYIAISYLLYLDTLMMVRIVLREGKLEIVIKEDLTHNFFILTTEATKRKPIQDEVPADISGIYRNPGDCFQC